MKITDDMLTGWFPHDIKPIHEGVYETVYRGHLGNPRRRIWNGMWWMYLEDPHQLCVFQDCDWRGLNKEPQRD